MNKVYIVAEIVERESQSLNIFSVFSTQHDAALFLSYIKKSHDFDPWPSKTEYKIIEQELEKAVPPFVSNNLYLFMVYKDEDGGLSSRCEPFYRGLDNQKEEGVVFPVDSPCCYPDSYYVWAKNNEDALAYFKSCTNNN